MTRHWPHVIVALAAITAAAVWPLTDALPARDVVQARVATAVIAAIACALFASRRSPLGRTGVAVSVVSSAVAVALLIRHFDALNACVVEFEGRSVIIGSAYTADMQQYLRDNPGSSALDRLFDAGGAPERLWTAASIRTCRVLVSWAGLAAIPLLAMSAAAVIPGRRYVLAPRPPTGVPSATLTPPAPVYDAFVSYRHLEPDRTLAFELLQTLEARGLRMAIDARDFSANENFLAEMERCIKQSRFVLCVVTAQYVLSEYTSEEAIIAKTLDLAERRKRLVPLIFERVDLPVWLHGLVGVDFTPAVSVDPNERLVHLLAAPSASTRRAPLRIDGN